MPTYGVWVETSYLPVFGEGKRPGRTCPRGNLCRGCPVLHQSVYAQYVALKEGERHTQMVHNVRDFLRWRSLDEYFFYI